MELRRAALTIAPGDTKRHLCVPVEVPAGLGNLRVTLTFSPWMLGDLKNLVTLSLTGPQAFRGAGHRHGDRHEVFVSPQAATPGYLPGDIDAGTWTVGLHVHLALTPLEALLVVEGDLDSPELPLSSEVTPLSPEPLPALPPLPPGAWMAGDLHCHTVHSDGRWTARELAQAALAHGLRFLALTDHNTTSGRPELARHYPGVLLPGLELTTFYGHAVVIGRPEYVDWTALTQEAGMRAVAGRLRADPLAYLTIAHPFAPGDPFCTGCTWTYFDLRPAGATHLEVWNGPWSWRDNAHALAHWYDLLADGRRVTATAGTDNHGPAYLPEHGLTCTPATDDPGRLAAQLAAGETYLARAATLRPSFRTPDGASVPLGGTFTGGPLEVELAWDDLPGGSRLVWIIDGQRTEEDAAPLVRRRVNVRAWLNMELRSAGGELLAVTNPVYARQGRASGTE